MLVNHSVNNAVIIEGDTIVFRDAVEVTIWTRLTLGAHAQRGLLYLSVRPRTNLTA